MNTIVSLNSQQIEWWKDNLSTATCFFLSDYGIFFYTSCAAGYPKISEMYIHIRTHHPSRQIKAELVMGDFQLRFQCIEMIVGVVETMEFRELLDKKKN